MLGQFTNQDVVYTVEPLRDMLGKGMFWGKEFVF
jgi:hypothetical protein